MHLVYPADYFDAKKVEEQYAAEASAMTSLGFSVSTLPQDTPSFAGALKPVIKDTLVVYRGWMLTATEYKDLWSEIDRHGGKAITDLNTYLATHHIPNWYPLIPEYTAETVFLQVDSDLETQLSQLAWDGFFIKDHVKSLKTSMGSVITDPKDVNQLVEEMAKYRGHIEGGLSIRRLEEYLPNTEIRYFVFDGKPYHPEDAEIPAIVETVAARIPSRFFSIDIAKRKDGELRVVEIGDGQVSDTVGWSEQAFANAFGAGFGAAG